MAGGNYKKWVGTIQGGFTSGGNATVSTKDLPQGRILGLLLRIKTDVTQAAGAAAITGSQLFRAFDLVRITDRCRATGRGLTYLRWLMAGSTFQMPQDVPAAAAVYSRFIDVYVPFVDLWATSPLDTAVPSDLLKSEEAIQIGWGNIAALYGANTSFTSPTVRAIFYFDKAKPDEVPSETEINYFDANQQSSTLPAKGGISHLLVYSETTDALTDTLFDTWTIFVDGEAQTPVLQTGELVAEFDLFRAAGVTALATATGVGGESIYDEPGVGAGAGQGMAALPMIPIIAPPGNASGYSMTHLPQTDGTLRVDFTGTATTARFLQRTIKYGSPQRARELLRQMNYPEYATAKLTKKVAGFGRLSQRASTLLPYNASVGDTTYRNKGGQ